MRSTIENIMQEFGVESLHGGGCIKEESLVLHSTVKNNVCEARIIGYLEMPDGSEWECNEVIEMRFERLPAATEAGGEGRSE